MVLNYCDREFLSGKTRNIIDVVGYDKKQENCGKNGEKDMVGCVIDMREEKETWHVDRLVEREILEIREE